MQEKTTARSKAVPLGGLAALALVGLASAPAHASVVVSSSGIDIQSPPPSSVVQNKDANATEIIGFQEKKNVVLASTLSLDVFNGSGNPIMGSLAAGTHVDSFFLQSDPPGSTLTKYHGSITFNGPILGVIIDHTGLDDTDSTLGLSPTTTYDKNGLRGLELESDKISLSGDTLTLDLNTSTSVDDIRILTPASTPEPSTVAPFALLGLGLLGLGVRKRRQA